jgi:hypothetical protein
MSSSLVSICEIAQNYSHVIVLTSNRGCPSSSGEYTVA